MTQKKMPMEPRRSHGQEQRNDSIHSKKPLDECQMVSGQGQFHTANPTAANPKPYIPITIEEIYAMAADPPSVAKDDALWVIPSTTIDEWSRVHEHQRMNGNYPVLWLDIDKVEGFTFEKVVEGVRRALMGFRHLIYSTSGATTDKPKSRVIIPLEDSIPGSDYSMFAKILNDRIEAEGLPPDRASERPGQLCYLPNKGKFYQHTVVDGILLSPAIDLAGEIKAEQARLKKIEAELKQRHLEALAKIQERITLGQLSPIQAYREEYPIELALELQGYERSGDKWLSPLSESNNPGVSIPDEDRGKWNNHHENDKYIGRPMKGGGTWGDSFDLFVYYEHGGTLEHGGDFKEALKAAGAMFTTVDQANGQTVSITKLNQREFMRNHDRQTAAQMFEEDADSFDMTQFSMVGRSAEMEFKMMEDKFVLERLAILGQSTIIYAKPNMGKTLLVICLIITAIKNGQIKGEDVFYINADDTYKGMVHKLKLAEKHGFHMLAPGHGPKGGPVFKSQDLAVYLNKMIQGKTANGKILILDTVKKFTDLMSKGESSKFGNIIREFISHGGTTLMLAHANKHRDEDKKIIYSGTTDLVDDADCAFTLDLVQDDPAGTKTVKFENLKCRGDVALEAFYQYNYLPGTTYFDRLDSVTSLDKEDQQKVERQRAMELKFKKNQVAVDAIMDCIKEGITKKTELLKEAMSRSGVSRSKTTQALLDHTGADKAKFEFWRIEIGEKNAQNYQLNG